MTRSGSVGGRGSCSPVGGAEGAGGGPLILDASISAPAWPGRGCPGRRAPRSQLPGRGAWSWAAGSARPSVRPVSGLGSPLPRRRRRLPLLLLLLLPSSFLLASLLPSFLASPPPFTFPEAGGAAGAGRGEGCLGAYCWPRAEGPGRSPRAARRGGTRACGRRAGWLRAAAGVQRPRVRGMSGLWLRRAPPPSRAPLRCRGLARCARLRSGPNTLRTGRAGGLLLPSFQSRAAPVKIRAPPSPPAQPLPASQRPDSVRRRAGWRGGRRVGAGGGCYRSPPPATSHAGERLDSTALASYPHAWGAAGRLHPLNPTRTPGRLLYRPPSRRPEHLLWSSLLDTGRPFARTSPGCFFSLLRQSGCRGNACGSETLVFSQELSAHIRATHTLPCLTAGAMKMKFTFYFTCCFSVSHRP